MKQVVALARVNDEQDKDMKAVIAIGSSTRSNVPADDFSDLDLIIVTSAPDRLLICCGKLPRRIQNKRFIRIKKQARANTGLFLYLYK